MAQLRKKLLQVPGCVENSGQSSPRQSDSTVYFYVHKHPCVGTPETSGDIHILALGCWVQTESQISTGKSGQHEFDHTHTLQPVSCQGSLNVWKQLSGCDQCLVQLSITAAAHTVQCSVDYLRNSARMTGMYKHAGIICRFCQTCQNRHTCVVIRCWLNSLSCWLFRTTASYTEAMKASYGDMTT